MSRSAGKGNTAVRVQFSVEVRADPSPHWETPQAPQEETVRTEPKVRPEAPQRDRSAPRSRMRASRASSEVQIPTTLAGPIETHLKARPESQGRPVRPASLARTRRQLFALAAFVAAQGVNGWDRAGGVVLRTYFEHLEEQDGPRLAIEKARAAIRPFYAFLRRNGHRRAEAFPILGLSQRGPREFSARDPWEDLPLGPAAEAYLQHCRIMRRLSINTLSAYGSALQQLCQFLDRRGLNAWCEVTRRDAMAFLVHLHERKLSVGTACQRASIIRGLLSFLATQGIRLDDGAVTDVRVRNPPHRLPRAMSTEEVERVIARVRGEDPASLRDRAILELAYASGLRASELMDLSVQQVDLRQRQMRLIGKGDKERIALFGKRAEEAVREYLANGRPDLMLGRSPDHARLFVNTCGYPLSRASLWKIVRHYAVLAQIPFRVSPHTFRHTFATHMLIGGANLAVVQALMGHESMTTTALYIHLDVRHLQEAIAKFHPRG